MEPSRMGVGVLIVCLFAVLIDVSKADRPKDFGECQKSFMRGVAEIRRSTSEDFCQNVYIYWLCLINVFESNSSSSSEEMSDREELFVEKEIQYVLGQSGIKCDFYFGNQELARPKKQSSLGLVFGLVVSGCILVATMAAAACLYRRRSTARRHTQTVRRPDQQANPNPNPYVIDTGLNTSAAPPGTVCKPPAYQGPLDYTVSPPSYELEPPRYEDVIQQ